MSFAHPSDDGPPCDVVYVGERAFGHPVLEVVAPAPQSIVELLQQVGQCSMSSSACQLPDLSEDRGKRLLRRPGVDIPLRRPSLDLPLDTEAEKVKPLVDVADPAFVHRQA